MPLRVSAEALFCLQKVVQEIHTLYLIDHLHEHYQVEEQTGHYRPQVTVSKSAQHYRLEMIAERNFQAGSALPSVQLLSHTQRKFMENTTVKSLHLLVRDFKDK